LSQFLHEPFRKDDPKSQRSTALPEKNEVGLEKRLATLWHRKTIMKKVHACCGQKPEWEIPVKMKVSLALVIFLGSLIASRAEIQTPISLWPNDAPGALGNSANDIPTITPYLPDAVNATGAAMVICPGGAYAFLSPHEGNDYALWLNQHGITCFVLKYRLGSNGYHYPAEFEDVTRAIRWARARAVHYKIDPHRIGIMGS
jgi:alpha/beta hydrolase fold